MTTAFPDLAPITQHLRAKAGSHLLVAAVHHFEVLELLAVQPMSFEDLQLKLGLRLRPAMVLFPSLCAMGIIRYNDARHIELTSLGSFLTRANPGNLIG